MLSCLQNDRHSHKEISIHRIKRDYDIIFANMYNMNVNNCEYQKVLFMAIIITNYNFLSSFFFSKFFHIKFSEILMIYILYFNYIYIFYFLFSLFLRSSRICNILCKFYVLNCYITHNEILIIRLLVGQVCLLLRTTNN